MHRGDYEPQPLTRREMLMQATHGFGGIALASLLARNTPADDQGKSHLTPRPTHFAAKAKSVIFLYMDGGPSQVDTFDPKPLLSKYNGRNPHEVLKVEPTQFNNVGKVLASPWKFKKYGKSGIEGQ